MSAGHAAAGSQTEKRGMVSFPEDHFTAKAGQALEARQA
jgi:hypothetical protein